MKQIFAVFGACLTLGAFSMPAPVHASPVVSVNVIDEDVMYMFTVTETDNVVWTDGAAPVPVGSNVFMSFGSNGIRLFAVTPDGTVLDNVVWSD